jgi:hypothetical protein
VSAEEGTCDSRRTLAAVANFANVVARVVESGTETPTLRFGRPQVKEQSSEATPARPESQDRAFPRLSTIARMPAAEQSSG